MKALLPGLLAVVLLGFAGCEALRESEAGQTEKMLSAAGFQVRPADTPKRQAALAAMTPYKIQMHVRNGTVYYVYADPRQNCLYVGGQPEYAAYQKLAIQQNIADQQAFAAQQQQMAAMDWDLWGPWGFGGVPPPMRVGPLR